MPRWMTRSLAWARDNLFRRARPRPLTAAVGYERAGITRWEIPVPWTADAAVIDVLLRLPAAARRKTDYAFRLPFATFPADTIRQDADDRYRVTFRFPVPAETVRGDLLWRGRVIANLSVQVLTPASFVSGLTLAASTVFVQLAGSTIATSAFVPDRCEGMLASAVVRCQSALAPLAELGLRAVFHNESSGRVHTIPILLTTSQLLRQEAVATALCPEIPRQPGGWWVTWMADDRMLATQRVHAIPAERFEAGVRVLETRFAARRCHRERAGAEAPTIAGRRWSVSGHVLCWPGANRAPLRSAGSRCGAFPAATSTRCCGGKRKPSSPTPRRCSFRPSSRSQKPAV